ncbi:MAG: hypothetical protein LBG83_07685 [Oscillospiraceae bacterium]|nr:hypothetical protein [Oscillospiraceae bacterium]
MSKYYASGSGSASAHIAKWDIACESPVDPTDGSAYIKFRPAEGATESKVYTNKIIITNNSEVMATPAPYVDVIASSGPAGTFTYTLARTDAAAATPVPVGGSATYTLTVTDNQTSTSPQDAMAQIRIKVYAVQVD